MLKYVVVRIGITLDVEPSVNTEDKVKEIINEIDYGFQVTNPEMSSLAKVVDTEMIEIEEPAF